jgi:uridine kinase
VQWVAHLSLDYFYRSLLPTEDAKTYNFDHPGTPRAAIASVHTPKRTHRRTLTWPRARRAEAFDWELVKQTLRQLKEGKKVDVPTYDFKTHKRTNVTKTLYGADVILFEGILSFHEKVHARTHSSGHWPRTGLRARGGCQQDVRDLMDIKIFVDEDADIRLSRRSTCRVHLSLSLSLGSCSESFPLWTLDASLTRHPLRALALQSAEISPSEAET